MYWESDCNCEILQHIHDHHVYPTACQADQNKVRVPIDAGCGFEDLIANIMLFICILWHIYF